MGLFHKHRNSTSPQKSAAIPRVLSKRGYNSELRSQVEEVLLSSDFGWELSTILLDLLEKELRSETGEITTDLIQQKLFPIVSNLWGERPEITIHKGRLSVILMIGNNGAGKTTTILKLAYYLKNLGIQKITLAGGDTFRAGAKEQLAVHAKAIGTRFIDGGEKATPAAVLYSALESAKAHCDDVLIVDTAGRLGKKVNLMDELAKMKRILAQKLPPEEGDLTKLLVLDAGVGQSALTEFDQFDKAMGIDGVVLSKADGRGRGGILVALAQQRKASCFFVGTGENKEDLEPFDKELFTKKLLSSLLDGNT